MNDYENLSVSFLKCSESFELFTSGLYEMEELRRLMNKRGLTLSKSQFPTMLENVLYIGKIFVPEFKGEEAQVVQGLHEPIVPEDLFNKVQRMLKSNQNVFGNGLSHS